MDTRLYSVVDSSGVYRAGGGQSASDGVDLAAAFYADATALPSCHQLRSPRTAASIVDNLNPAPNTVSRDFVARAFYDGVGGGRGSITTGPGSFWDRRRSSFAPDSMAPGVIGGYDGTTGLATADTRPCRSDSISGKDTVPTPGCSASSVANASITSSMTSSSSSLSRKKKPIGRHSDFDLFLVGSIVCDEADIAGFLEQQGRIQGAVSYTHLTLPTIYSV